MKKLFSLLLALSLAAFITSCAVKRPGFEESKKPPKDDLSSLRKHLAFKEWPFLPISQNETIVSFYAWSGRDSTINILKNALKEYCEAQGGKFYRDGGFCKEGKDPFIFRIERGYAKYYKSSGTYYYLYFAYIETTKPDVDLDYGFYDLEFINKARLLDLDTFIKENSGFGSAFNDLQKKGNTYIFEVYTYNATPPGEVTGKTFGNFWKLIEYCKAHNGEVKKKYNNENYQPFSVWMKEIFLEHSGMTFNSIKYKPFPLNGEYLCTSQDQPFKFTMYGVRVIEALGGFAVYRVKLQKLKSIPKVSEKSQISGTKQRPIEKTFSSTGPMTIEDKLALDAAAVKSQILKRNGPRLYTAAYAFPKDGCDYVVVIDKIPRMGPPNIMTYKICSGKITQKVPTRVVEPLPEFIKPKLQDVIKQAKLRGFAMYEDNYGYIVVAKSLRSNDLCSLDTFVLHNEKTIYHKTVNACQ